VGFGQRQDFNADSALVKNQFAYEENTDWFKFVGSTDTSVSITIEPNDSTQEYDMVVFKSSGDSVGSDLRNGLIPSIRSNFAKISNLNDTITGFYCDHRLYDHVPSDSLHQFSRAFWMQTGETYYLVLNTPNGKGKGYKLRIHACAPGSAGNKNISNTIAKASGPEITSFFPTRAGEGKEITIIGKHLNGATSVTFGGVEAEKFYVISDTKIKAVVGSGTSGNISVSSALGVAEKDYFTWLERGKIVKKSGLTRKKRKKIGDNGDYYIVKSKDTMFSIAFIFGMTVDEVLKLNNLRNTNVFVGQKLKVLKRELPQKKIEKIQSQAKPVKPSAPLPGSTTDPKVIAKAVEEQKSMEPVKAIEGKLSNFTPTPNMPKENPTMKSEVEDKNSLAPFSKSFYVYANVTSGVNKQPVGGTLQVIDLKKKTLVYNVQANKTQAVPLFNEGGKQKLIICDIFGYKKQDFDLNLDNIINDSTAQQVQIVDDTIVVNFELKRLEKGDVAVAYNIFFYDDASVMLPKSTYELDQLLELMTENNKIKIRIHGHTNTSKLGKILYLEKGDKTFFRLTAKNKETFGPARQLSKKRAETIKYYLESKRISDNRIETEGHGGSDMLYPNTHPLSYKNKRVEIEILADK
jgi:outer membrane protein OmpA-like peptidoglycan-associated protein/LysM repeat protein